MSSYKVLITGQNRGLGAALAKKFEECGHFVLFHGGRSDCDISSVEDTTQLAKKANAYNIDVLINNAAIVCPNIQFEDYSTEKIQNMINVNLLAPILLTNLMIKNLKHVVNINSMVGLEVKSPRTLYSATKWGLRGFSNSLKKENTKLCVLDVYPTNIKTTPDRENAMELDMVVNKIYNSFLNKEQELILDGRKI